MKPVRLLSVGWFLLACVAGLWGQNGAAPQAGQIGARADQALAGDWTGGFWLGDRWVAINLRLNRQNEQSRDTADVIFPFYGGSDNAMNVPVEKPRATSAGLHLEIPVRTGGVILDGRQTGGTIEGHFAYNQAEGGFGLSRVATVTPESLVEYYGAYRVSPDRVISILRGWSYARTLNYVDYETGEVGTLWPSSRDEFFSGSGLAVSFPVGLRVSFARDGAGRVRSLSWKRGAQAAVAALRIATREERVTFRNGEVVLGGTLILPATTGRHPVIVITPGDYGTNRDQLRLWAHHYVSQGIGAFIFDARGGGESTGLVNSSSFSELANDVLAGIQTLKARDDVNPRQIGLFGFSNSAFTVSLAASHSIDVAFLILQSWVGVLPWKQESFRAETQLRVDGFPEEVVKRGAEFMRLKYETARTGKGWERIQEILQQARGERWLAYTNPPSTLERLQAVYASTMTYDPVPALEKLRIPVLAFWGEKDTYLPVEETITNFERAMAKAGNRHYVIKVYPNRNHSLLDTDSGSPSTGGTEKAFPPGFWKMKSDWVLRQGLGMKNGSRESLEGDPK